MAGAVYRAATPADSAGIVRLIDLAGDGLPLFRWGELAGEGRDAVAFATEWVAGTESRFSHRHVRIAEIDGEVAGMMLGCREPLAAAEALPDIGASPIRPWRDLEVLAAGSWLLRAIAVLPEYRGRGIARALLNMADDLARNSGADKLAIIAAEENPVAMMLYERHGFERLARRKILPWPDAPHNGDWVLLVKRL